MVSLFVVTWDEDFLGDFCLGKLEYGLKGKCILGEAPVVGDDFLPNNEEMEMGLEFFTPVFPEAVKIAIGCDRPFLSFLVAVSAEFMPLIFK